MGADSGLPFVDGCAVWTLAPLADNSINRFKEDREQNGYGNEKSEDAPYPRVAPLAAGNFACQHAYADKDEKSEDLRSVESKHRLPPFGNVFRKYYYGLHSL